MTAPLPAQMAAQISLAAAVEGALQTRKIIATHQLQLQEYEAVIIAAARSGEQIPLEDESREGRQYIARGITHEIPVILTADLLVGSFKRDSEAHAKISAAAGEHFLKFFTPVSGFENAFKDGRAFRLAANGMLGLEAPAFIVACVQRDKFKLPKSATKIEWDRARDLNAA